MRSSLFDPTSDVHEGAVVGDGTRIWGFSQVREGAEVGRNCNIGRNVYIGSGVIVGDNCKIQNGALVYEPAVIGDGVFVGPSVVFTNDRFPRAVNPGGDLKSNADWMPVGVIVGQGASIGAKAVCVGPVKLGDWSVVAAGAVVSSDVRPFSLVRGIPARHAAWVGRAGVPLTPVSGTFVCPVTGEIYDESCGELSLRVVS